MHIKEIITKRVKRGIIPNCVRRKWIKSVEFFTSYLDKVSLENALAFDKLL